VGPRKFGRILRLRSQLQNLDVSLVGFGNSSKHPLWNDHGPILGYLMQLVKAKAKIVKQSVQK
jgi:hypothetical protein